jgi:hypothetical protein
MEATVRRSDIDAPGAGSSLPDCGLAQKLSVMALKD